MRRLSSSFEIVLVVAAVAFWVPDIGLAEAWESELSTSAELSVSAGLDEDSHKVQATLEPSVSTSLPPAVRMYALASSHAPVVGGVTVAPVRWYSAAWHM